MKLTPLLSFALLALITWPAYNDMIGLGWRKKESGVALEWLARRAITTPVPADFPTATAASVRGEIPLK